MQKGVQPTSIRSQLYAFLLFIRILSFTNYSMPCLLVYVINTISETIATYTRPRHTLQKSFVKLFPQTVFSNKLYCLGEFSAKDTTNFLYQSENGYQYFKAKPTFKYEGTSTLLNLKRRTINL